MTRIIFSLLLFAFVAVGCGRGDRPKDLPKLTPCEFAVQYEDGSPIDQAAVMMYPVAGKWFANGKTDSSGNVKVSTQGKYAGAAPGEYNVTVMKQETIYPPGYDPKDENAPDLVTNDLVDQEFAIPDKTPLKITVGTTAVKETLTVRKPK